MFEAAFDFNYVRVEAIQFLIDIGLLCKQGDFLFEAFGVQVYLQGGNFGL